VCRVPAGVRRGGAPSMTGTAVDQADHADHADQLVQLDESFMADPHALYEMLRRERPVTQARMPQGLRIWLVTRYADVRAALVDARLAKDAAGLSEVFDRRAVDGQQRVKWAQELSAHMLNSDPPDHTRLRKLVNRGFTPKAIGLLRSRIEQLAEE